MAVKVVNIARSVVSHFVEFLIKKFFQSCSARQDSHQCTTDLLLSVLQRANWSGVCISSLSLLHQLTTQHFDERYKHKQSKSFLSQPEYTIWVSRHRTLRTQYLYLDVFLWKQYIILASYKDFCKLQSFCLCTPLLTLT